MPNVPPTRLPVRVNSVESEIEELTRQERLVDVYIPQPILNEVRLNLFRRLGVLDNDSRYHNFFRSVFGDEEKRLSQDSVVEQSSLKIPDVDLVKYFSWRAFFIRTIVHLEKLRSVSSEIINDEIGSSWLHGLIKDSVNQFEETAHSLEWGLRNFQEGESSPLNMVIGRQRIWLKELRDSASKISEGTFDRTFPDRCEMFLGKTASMTDPLAWINAVYAGSFRKVLTKMNVNLELHPKSVGSKIQNVNEIREIEDLVIYLVARQHWGKDTKARLKFGLNRDLLALRIEISSIIKFLKDPAWKIAHNMVKRAKGKFMTSSDDRYAEIELPLQRGTDPQNPINGANDSSLAPPVMGRGGLMFSGSDANGREFFAVSSLKSWDVSALTVFATPNLNMTIAGMQALSQMSALRV